MSPSLELVFRLIPFWVQTNSDKHFTRGARRRAAHCARTFPCVLSHNDVRPRNAMLRSYVANFLARGPRFRVPLLGVSYLSSQNRNLLMDNNDTLRLKLQNTSLWAAGRRLRDTGHVVRTARSVRSPVRHEFPHLA